MDDCDAGGHLCDGVVSGHIVVTQDGEFCTAVQCMGGFLLGFRWQRVDIVFGQISAFCKEILLAVVGGVHVFVEATRHTLTVAFRHDTVSCDTLLQHKEINTALGTFLRKDVVFLFGVTRICVGAQLNHDGRVLYHYII